MKGLPSLDGGHEPGDAHAEAKPKALGLQFLRLDPSRTGEILP